MEQLAHSRYLRYCPIKITNLVGLRTTVCWLIVCGCFAIFPNLWFGRTSMLIYSSLVRQNNYLKPMTFQFDVRIDHRSYCELSLGNETLPLVYKMNAEHWNPQRGHVVNFAEICDDIIQESSQLRHYGVLFFCNVNIVVLWSGFIFGYHGFYVPLLSVRHKTIHCRYLVYWTILCVSALILAFVCFILSLELKVFMLNRVEKDLMLAAPNYNFPVFKVHFIRSFEWAGFLFVVVMVNCIAYLQFTLGKFWSRWDMSKSDIEEARFDPEWKESALNV